jgi:hypothetical protein
MLIVGAVSGNWFVVGCSIVREFYKTPKESTLKIKPHITINKFTAMSYLHIRSRNSSKCWFLRIAKGK